jgi:hypothetical protein
MVALRRDEHLGLVLQPTERLAVDDSVTVALVRRAEWIVLLRPAPARGIDAARGEPGEGPVFELLEPYPDLGMISVREHRILQGKANERQCMKGTTRRGLTCFTGAMT